MSAIVKEIKLTMSRIGVHAGVTNKVVYVPDIKITFEDPKCPPKRFYMMNLAGKFKKADYLGYVICEEFFVLIFKQEWEIISSKGELVTSMQPCGQIIGVEPDYFAVKEGNMLVGYDGKGKIIGSRELTEEEIAELSE